MNNLQSVLHDVALRLEKATSSQDIALVRSAFLGKKGVLGMALRDVGKLPESKRPAAGDAINQLCAQVEAMLADAAGRIAKQAMDVSMQAGRYDVTLPGRRTPFGAPHPLRLIEEEMLSLLLKLGFVIAEGPLVETDWYNFEALNIPADHPARDMQDTFFLAPGVVLRTHTSNVQIRTMMAQPPPVRIVAPGMVFRHDDVDATHSPTFHQLEGLWIDERATFSDLKGILRRLMNHLFGAGIEIRFRPSYFPFTEPSAELDIRCVACDGKVHQHVCRLCKGQGWLEVLGAGMVNPSVLQAVGYDPEKVQGFAFGIGLERIALIRWGIDDIRLFYENDLRFLEQFSADRHCGDC